MTDNNNGVLDGFLMGQQQNRGYNDDWGGNSSWIIIFLIFALMGWGNNGWGNGNLQGALTRGDLCQDMNFNNLEGAVRGVQNGLCDGFYAINTTLLNGFNSNQREMAAIAAQQQQCCCETNRNIDAVRYENAKNTCDIITAGSANTQKILDFLCQNKIDDLQAQVNAYQMQLSQATQTNTLINALRPTPVPAYPSVSPYQALNGWGFGSCGCSGYGA